MKKVFIVIAMLIGLPLSILFVNAWRKANNMNQEAVDQRGKMLAAFDEYRKQLVADNYKQIYSDTSPEFKRTSSFEEFEGIFQALQLKNGRLIELTRVGGQAQFQNNAWTGVIDAEYAYEKRKFVIRHIFRREGSAWVLYGISNPPDGP